MKIKNSMVEIKELLLRIPGLGAEEAQRLGEEIAQMIANKLPVGVGGRYIDNLDLQITIPAGNSKNDLAEKVSASILEEIGRHINSYSAG